MPELTLWLTRNIRTDRVKRSIAGISNISDYDSPEKWEKARPCSTRSYSRK